MHLKIELKFKLMNTTAVRWIPMKYSDMKKLCFFLLLLYIYN